MRFGTFMAVAAVALVLSGVSSAETGSPANTRAQPSNMSMNPNTMKPDLAPGVDKRSFAQKVAECNGIKAQCHAKCTPQAAAANDYCHQPCTGMFKDACEQMKLKQCGLPGVSMGLPSFDFCYAMCMVRDGGICDQVDAEFAQINLEIKQSKFKPH